MALIKKTKTQVGKYILLNHINIQQHAKPFRTPPEVTSKISSQDIIQTVLYASPKTFSLALFLPHPMISSKTLPEPLQSSENLFLNLSDCPQCCASSGAF